MKHLKLIAILFFAGLSVLPGCSGGGGSASPTFSMTATIGSVHMNGNSCVAALVGSIMGISGSTITSGVAGTPPQINISIPNWTGATGTFAIGPATSTSNTFAQYIASPGAYAKLSQSGSVSITSVSSTVVTGTFYFTCTDGTSITSGAFTAKR